jgi:protein O-GlcNAc transferase
MPEPIQVALDHYHAGRVEHAERALRRVLERWPEQPVALRTLATILASKQRYDQADFYFQRALRVSPDNANLQLNYAGLLMHLLRAGDARRCFERALELDPVSIEARLGLSAALSVLGAFEEAAQAGRDALQRDPTNSAAAVNLGLALSSSGQAAEACEVFAEALKHDQRNPSLISNYLGTLNYDPAATPERRAAEHRRWGTVLQGVFGPLAARPAINDPDPARRLRVGLLSSDLRGHVVAGFLKPFMRHRDREGIELWAFSTGVRDAASAELQGLCDHWVDALQMDDDTLAAAIRGAKIDILLETNGHTEGSRPGVLAARPAPVIASYCGYPNTTGMPAVDYRVVDEHTDPAGHEALSTERLVRLKPAFLCYEPPPPARMPGVAPGPAERGEGRAGEVTFGSFNAAAKINPPLLRLWCGLLKAVPGSRLVIKNRALGAAEARARVMSVLEGEGLAPDRVELVGWRPSSEDHLAEYARVDIALDSLPYHGTTTTCEALLMGVPVVTLAGGAHVTRVGASLLRSVGLDALVAADEGEYVRIAAELARDAGRRRELRASLRNRLLASPLCEQAAHGRAMSAALRQMWTDTLRA